jgi:phospholipase A1
VEGGHGLSKRHVLHTAAALAVLVHGQAAGTTPQDCVAIDDDSARLACFDRAHGRGRVAVPATPTITPVPPTAAVDAPAVRTVAGGLLTRAWALDGEVPTFQLLPYRSIYVLPLSATDNINRRPFSPAPGHSTGVDLPNQSVEAKFQISAKTLAWRSSLGDLWIAYTQSSRWQLYQEDISRPFRETNYEPELIFNIATDFEAFGWRGRMAGVSLNHQSNGRALPLSRSWNRVIGHLGLERDAWSVMFRPWLRINESADSDDNPDIEDYAGRAALTVRHETSAGHRLSLQLRHSLRSGERSRGAGELEWAFPLKGQLHGFTQLFSGYGESLIDYNIRQSRIGVGFSLAGWD